MIKTLINLLQNQRGATAVEYGLIAALIVIASIGAFDAVSNENTGLWGRVSTAVTEVMNRQPG